MATAVWGIFGLWIRKERVRHRWGKYACFEWRNTPHFRKDRPAYLAKIEKYKENRKCGKNGDNGNQKGGRWENGTNKGKGENSGVSARFAELGGDIPRNSATSTDCPEGVFEENEAIFADREV